MIMTITAMMTTTSHMQFVIICHINKMNASPNSYPLVSEISNTPHYERTILGGDTIARTLLSNLFFSSKNIDIIQNGIRYAIWSQTPEKAVIGRQPNTELVIVMRGVYLDRARHLPTHIPEQIAELNEITIRKVVPTIISNIGQYRGYLQKITSPLDPIPRSLNVSSVGTRTLPPRAPAM